MFSCQTEHTEELESEKTSIPKVLSAESTSASYVDRIRQISANGRTNETLSFSDAITATYEGFEEAKLVFVPSLNSDNIQTVFKFVDKQIVDNVFTIERTTTGSVYSNSEGSMTLVTDSAGGLIDVKIDVNTSTNGRTNCSYAQGFMDCAGAVQDQLVAAIGSYGALIADLACGYWAPCAGAFAVGCAAMAVAHC